MHARVLLLVSVIVVLPGCLSGSEPAPSLVEDVAPQSADPSGPGPAAPTQAYAVEAAGPGGDGDEASAPAKATAYPLRMETSAAKAAVVREFTGAYEAQRCLPNGELPLGGLGLAEASDFHEFTGDVAVGDVLGYDIQMTYANSDASWADLHLGFNLGTANGYWTEPTSGSAGEVVMNFTGQAYRGSEDEIAFVTVDCWYGQVTEPIPYSIVVTLTFAEGAIPASLPVQVTVPAGATRLFVTSLPTGDGGTPSHFRVFRPDDSVLCECALSSEDRTAGVPLDGAGEYVVLVDHTANGFVTLALDVPSDGIVTPLALEWVQHTVFSSDGSEGVDETTTITLPSVPLDMGAWVFAPEWESDAPFSMGAGKGYRLTVSSARGDVLRQVMPGHFTYRATAAPVLWTNDWFPIPLGDEWEFTQDHHAFDRGDHAVRVEAEAFRGEVVVWARQYVRA